MLAPQLRRTRIGNSSRPPRIPSRGERFGPTVTLILCAWFDSAELVRLSPNSTSGGSPMATLTMHSSPRAERVAARAFMVLNVIVLLAIGFSLLSSPIWIPITVMCWLAAAAIAGLAIWGPLAAA